MDYFEFTKIYNIDQGQSLYVDEIYKLIEHRQSYSPFFNRELGYDLMEEVKVHQDLYDYHESGNYDFDCYFNQYLKSLEDEQLDGDIDWTPIEESDQYDIPFWKSTSDRITELLKFS